MTTSHIKPKSVQPGQQRWTAGALAVAPSVWLREHWEDPWDGPNGELAAISNWLRVDAVEWGVNPKIRSATLSFRYGVGFRDGTASGLYEIVPRANLTGMCVRIVVPYETYDADAEQPGWTASSRPWWGIIVEESDARDGSFPFETTDESQRVPAGVQRFTAYDMTWVLQQMLVTHSVVRTYEDGFPLPRVVKKALAFNAPTPRCEEGNQANGTSDYGTCGFPIHLFSGDTPDVTTTTWSTEKIVEYMLGVFTGQSSWDVGEFGTRIPFRLYDPMGQLFAWDKPLVETEGRTVKEVLDSVMDRRRLLGYAVSVDETKTPDVVLVQPFTFTAADLDVDPEELSRVYANPYQVALDCSDAVDVENFTIHRTIAQKYDKVVVRGHPIVCCGTFSTEGGLLVKHWTEAAELFYDAAASGDAGYPTDVSDRERANKAYRARDAYSRVYSWFGLPVDWDGTAGDGLAGAQEPLFPESLNAGFLESTPELTPWYWPELRFLSKLPILDVDTIPDVTKKEYRSMFAVMWVPFTAGTRYVQLDKMCDNVEPLDDNIPTDWSAHLRPQTEAPGVVLTISGRPQHLIAKDTWTPILTGGDLAEDAALDYRNNLLVTVAMECARRAEQYWPNWLGLDNEDDFRKVLVIDYTNRKQGQGNQFDGRPGSQGANAKGRGRVWWIAPYTMLGVVAATGVLERESAAGRFEKDERPAMLAVAKLVYNWYASTRRALTLSVKQPFFDLLPGNIISSLVDGATLETVQSVVTELHVDFTGETPRTTIQTECAELDIRHFD